MFARAIVAVALVLAGGCQRERTSAASPAILHVRITDGPGGPLLPGRVLLVDGDEPVRIGRIDLYGTRQARGYCMLADGALGTWDGIVVWRGEAEILVGRDDCEPSPAIVPGTYRVRAWHGLEHEMWEGEVVLAPGKRTELAIPLERAFRVEGALVADLHVHAAGSNDSGMPMDVRVMSMLAGGVQVIGLSDHYVNGDADAAIAELGVADRITSIASNEIGNDEVHFGAYPVPIDRGKPRGGSPLADEGVRWTPEQLVAWARSQPTHPVVQLNHPRLRSTALFDARGWDGRAWPPPFTIDFDAIEVLAGYSAFNAPGDRRVDQAVGDFYTLIGRGVLVTGLGNSDTHDLKWMHDGATRSYVLVDDARLDHFAEEAFVAAIRARRVVATSGPWLDVEVSAGTMSAGPGQALTARDGRVVVDVEVSQARWCRATEIRIRLGRAAGGHEVVRTLEIPPGQRTTRARVELEVGAADTWIGVDAGGDEPLPWELTGSYHREKGRPGAVPYAIINPVLVDGDGDGRVRYEAADVAVK